MEFLISMSASSADLDDFITRWKVSGGNEMANFQSFANDLVHILEC